MLFRLVALIVLALTVSCTSFPIPKNYVPDTKVVFLTQNTDFRPIAYPAVAADPYVFVPSLAPVDATKPAFLQTPWEKFLVADFQADSRLYREVEAYFGALLTLPAFQQLRAQLDSAVIQAPPPPAPDQGEKLKDYTNGALFTYPGAPGAQITVLAGGYYEIVYADKSRFRFQADGSYEQTDPAGVVTGASYPQQSQIVATVDGVTYTSAPGFKGLKGPRGSLNYSDGAEPQYHFNPPTVPSQQDVYFLDAQRQVKAVALDLSNGVRFDYFPKKTEEQGVGVLITRGDQAVFIDPQFEKSHLTFDAKTHRTTTVLSVFLPEGIRLTNFVGTGPAYGEVKAAWPEAYRVKAMGPFDVLYTPKDEALVAKLRADRLTAIEASDRKLTGLAANGRRTLVIPPDLASYRKLFVSRPGEVLNWYPSGFETRDIIVMWPISVPRYDAPAGQDYFFTKEFYEILVHEYVHVLIGENSGLASPVPMWLNEGLAVAIESGFTPEVKDYWDTTFVVSRGLKRLLDWDLVTTTGTGELPLPKARVHYAQSYALVSALLQKFGPGKVAQYIRSFRVNPADAAKVNLKVTYKTNFKAVFGVEFDQAVKLLDPPPAKP